MAADNTIFETEYRQIRATNEKIRKTDQLSRAVRGEKKGK